MANSAGLIKNYLERLHQEIASNQDGEIATYIPELAKADSNWLALAIATADGAVYVAGDADLPFTIQSLSKPFLYGLALETLGRDAVLGHVGVEPTGEAFNSTVLDAENNRPFNPMVNAGAIVVSGLVEGASYLEKRAAMLRALSIYAGRPLEIHEPTFLSERETGDRNRAIASLMKSAGMLRGNVEETLDVYFSQCSVSVTCRDLALMAATLANGGCNPSTNERALPQEYVHDVLTVMNSCGMYNYAGQWSYEVGIPAKSGVSGAVTAVIPGQIGIAAFSPRLDKFGNSVRAVEACKRIAADFGLHVFRTPPSSLEVIRRELSGADIRSKRGRTAREYEVLAQRGGDIRVLEAQGALFFGSTERIVRRVETLSPHSKFIILDFRRVFSADIAACALLERMIANQRKTSARLIFANVKGRKELAALHAILLDRSDYPSFQDRDMALEWCEAQLLGQAASKHPDVLTLNEVALFQGFAPEALQRFSQIAQPVEFEPGSLILKEDEAADRFLVILRGSVSVRLDLGGTGARSMRVAAYGPAATVGEMALLQGGRRSADVVADDATLCLSFDLDAFWSLADQIEGARETVYANLARDMTTRLRAANREIRALEE